MLNTYKNIIFQGLKVKHTLCYSFSCFPGWLEAILPLLAHVFQLPLSECHPLAVPPHLPMKLGSKLDTQRYQGYKSYGGGG